MTSIKPSDYPSPTCHKSKSPNGGSPSKSPCKKNKSADPFLDEAIDACGESRCDLECLSNSPQDERVALPINIDSERQPLLGSSEAQRERAGQRRKDRWSLVAVLLLGMVVGGVIVGGVLSMQGHSEHDA